MTLTTLPYTWKNVRLGSGGRITGIVGHPGDPRAVYIRTDVGGIYRWDEAPACWTPLTDWIPPEHPNWSGIESLALDPHHPERLFAVAGAYPWLNDQALLRSDDFGATWQAFPLPFVVSANFTDPSVRWSGERLLVDPHNPAVLYYGTRAAGLWRSLDGGQSWHPAPFPVCGLNVFHADFQLGTGSGLSWVVADPTSGPVETAWGRVTRCLYVGVTGDNARGTAVPGTGVYVTRDGGQTWALLAGGPDGTQSPMRAALAANGALYVTFFSNQRSPAGSVWTYRPGAGWQDITPRRGLNYVGLALDPGDPGTLMVAEYVVGRGSVFRSRDGGQTWQPEILDLARFDPQALPWLGYTLANLPEYRFGAPALISTLLIDPCRPQRVWLVDGWTAWRTEDITPSDAGRPTHWTCAPHGIEETFAFALHSPSAGSLHLVSALADIDGAAHTGLDHYPARIHAEPCLRNSSGLDAAPLRPNLLLRVGETWDETAAPFGGFSTDGGSTWTRFAAAPLIDGKPARSGKVALTPDGSRWLWLPVDSGAFWSADQAHTWIPSQDSPTGVLRDVWQNHRPLAADRCQDGVFYIYHQGRLYCSQDGGGSFAPTPARLPVLEPDLQPAYGIATLGTDAPLTLLAAPDAPGELWLALHGFGLFHSADFGHSFTRLPGFESAGHLAFGCPAPGQARPRLYVLGSLRGHFGLYAAGLQAALHDSNWQLIETARLPLGNFTSCLQGDARRPGAVFVGTYGRGVFYGEPDER